MSGLYLNKPDFRNDQQRKVGRNLCRFSKVKGSLFDRKYCSPFFGEMYCRRVLIVYGSTKRIKKSLSASFDQFNIEFYHILKIFRTDALVGAMRAFEVFFIHPYGHKTVDIGAYISVKTGISSPKH